MGVNGLVRSITPRCLYCYPCCTNPVYDVGNTMKLEPALPVEQPNSRQADLIPLERCACGMMIPSPGYAPIGAHLKHCIKHHVPYVKPTVYCRACGLCRVRTEGETCTPCVTTLLRTARQREIQTKPVVLADCPEVP